MHSSPFSPQTFWIEGLSAVSEYIKWKPAAVLEVQCIPKEQQAVKRLLSEHKSDAPLIVRDTKSDESPGRHPAPQRNPKALKGHGEGRDRPPQGHRGSGAKSFDRDPQRQAFTPTAPVSAKVLLSAVPVADWLGRVTKNPQSVVLALDHVQDPRNLGAILRSAAFFGVRSVLVPERRQVLLTQASVATAQGGFALSDLVCTVNLARTLRDLKDQGYWILGATMDGENLDKVAGQYEKTVLVLGAEDTGLSRGIEDTCDRKVAISGAGRLDSLNVSVAAGILLNSFTNSKLRP